MEIHLHVLNIYNRARVRFRLPDNFVDTENITKLYKGWFYNRGQERAVEVRNLNDVELLDNYILMAYNYTKEKG